MMMSVRQIRGWIVATTQGVRWHLTTDGVPNTRLSKVVVGPRYVPYREIIGVETGSDEIGGVIPEREDATCSDLIRQQHVPDEQSCEQHGRAARQRHRTAVRA